jgi:acyl-[acyl-carrier-protein] desaturase
MDALYKDDPNGTTLAFADMMRKQIVMPAHLMDDGSHEATNGSKRNLFAVRAHAHAMGIAWGVMLRFLPWVWV